MQRGYICGSMWAESDKRPVVTFWYGTAAAPSACAASLGGSMNKRIWTMLFAGEASCMLLWPLMALHGNIGCCPAASLLLGVYWHRVGHVCLGAMNDSLSGCAGMVK